MRKACLDFRLYLAERLLSLAFDIAPDCDYIKTHIATYFQNLKIK